MMWRSCLLELAFTPHSLNIVVDVKSLRQPHVFNLWLKVRKGMPPVRYFRSNKASFLSG